MHTRREVERRTLLCSAALAVAAAALDACTHQASPTAEGDAADRSVPARTKGSAIKPLPTPNKFHESPILTRMVNAGKLPPVDDRLPTHPYVVPHAWLAEGKYGGNLRLIIPATSDAQMKEYMYGHSPLRLINDGLDIAPGLAESWNTNTDISQFTLHFRRGLKWSDGKPWTTADIMFWWEDMVLNKEHPEVAPDTFRSAKGTLATVSAPDAHTLAVKFDTAVPLFPTSLATWVNAGNGPTLMAPKHYLMHFHPRYNKSLANSNWTDTFEAKRNYQINSDCPTMTGWRLTSYKDGQSMRWQRNPYYYCVNRNGDQLPYLDGLVVTAVSDQQLTKLKVQHGDVDYVNGIFAAIGLPDVTQIRAAHARNKLDVLLWNGGSGYGSLFFFNFNYHDAEIRAVIHNPKFRQALSHAVKRADIHKAVFFNRGELTTGTYSLEAQDFQVNKRGQQIYRQWRDSYKDYDPAHAKSLLDAIGVVDRDGDGKRELPNGKKLTVRLDQPAGAAEMSQYVSGQLKRDWEAIGITVLQNPVPPTSWGVQWTAGQLMTYTSWPDGAAGVHEVLVDPQLLIPLNGYTSFWGPMYANYDMIRNTPTAKAVAGTNPYKRTPPSIKPELGSPVDRLWRLYDAARVETDTMKRRELVWKMISIHISDGPFCMGVVANYPAVELAHEDLRNVPQTTNLKLGGFVFPWSHPTPAVYDPEVFFWRSPQEHSG